MPAAASFGRPTPTSAYLDAPIARSGLSLFWLVFLPVGATVSVEVLM